MLVRKSNVGFLVSFLALSLSAATLNVPADYATIHAAVSAAGSGDTVLVAAGGYTAATTGSSEGAYPIVVPAGVTLAGAGASPADTVIDAEGTGRVLTMGEGAIVRNLTLANSRPESSSGIVRGMLLDCRGGTVSNCVLRGGRNGEGTCEQFVYLDHATMIGCVVSNCVADGENIWGGNKGAGIYACSGSVLTNVTVAGNDVCGGTFTPDGEEDARSAGGVVVLHGSRMSGSLVCDNVHQYSESQSISGGVLLRAGSRLETTRVLRNRVSNHYGAPCTGGVNVPDGEGCVIDRCVISGNTSGGGDWTAIAGGVLVGNGSVMRNSLVVRNTADFYEIDECAGGVLMAVNSRIENCTVADNAYEAVAGASGIRALHSGEDPCSIVNCIVYDNGLSCDEGVVTYSLTPAEMSGAGNITGDPLFVNALAGDYALKLLSPCVDTGTELASVTVDLAGAARPQDGSGSGTPKTDMGCYEFVPSSDPISCTLVVETGLVPGPCSVTVSVLVIGDATGATYEWTCFNDDGPVAAGETYEPTITFDGLGYGVYRFSVTVTNGSGDKASDTTPPETPLKVSAATSYVSPTGSAAWPYATPETAAVNLNDAVDAAVSNVVVLAGTYDAMAHVTESGLDLVAAVKRPIVVSGAGTDATVIDCAGGGGILVSHADAVVRDLTIANAVGNSELSTIALKIVSGTVSNVVVRGGEDYAPTVGAAVQVSGLFVDGVVTNFAAGGWQDLPVVALTGSGVLRGVTVAGNHADTLPLMTAASGARLERCTIANNSAYSSVITLAGAEMTGCAVTGNFHRSGATVVLSEAAALRRCRVQGNTSTDAILYVPAWDSGSIENCLVADNQVTGESAVVVVDPHDATLNMTFTTVAGNSAAAGAGGVLCDDHDGETYARLNAANCILWGNTLSGSAGDLVGTSPSIATFSSCYSEATPTEENKNLASDPVFAAPAAGDYQLTLSSPCVDSANDTGEQPTSVDLVGMERPQDGKGTGIPVSDRGCYEFVPSEDPLTCEISVSTERAAAPASVTVSAVVGGTRLAGLAYEWTCVHVFGDVTNRTVQTTDVATCVFGNLGYGRCVFEVKVTNSFLDEAKATSSPVLVCAVTTYVSPSGGHVWPFETAAKAATNFTEAIDAAASNVVAMAGDYSTMAHVTDTASGLDVLAAVRRPISLAGEGTDVTVVDCAGKGGFLLADPGARLSDLSVVNACAIDDEDLVGRVSALNILSGTASNLVIRGGYRFYSQGHAAVEMTGGLLVDSDISGFVYHNWGAAVVSVGGATLRGVRISGNDLHDVLLVVTTGSTLENCAFCGNLGYETLASFGGSTFSDCLFADNTNSHAAFKVNNATFRRCRILRTSVVGGKSDGAVVSVAEWSNNLFENCLVADNVSDGGRGIIYLSPSDASLRLVNTTVAGNSATSLSAGIWCGQHPDWEDRMARLRSTNSILWGNLLNGAPCSVVGDSTEKTLTYSCYPEAVPSAENHNVNADPRFKAGYFLRSTSPCVAAGDASVWSEAVDPTDLAGAPRLDRSGHVDLGCFETIVNGLLILFR